MKTGPLGMRVCEPPCHSAAACLHPDNCRANMKWENERAATTGAPMTELPCSFKKRACDLAGECLKVMHHSPVDKMSDLKKEIRRLRKIEHAAWHVCESSEERVAEGEIIVLSKDFKTLSKLLQIEHPPHYE